jgi:hypothetical protein
MSLIENSDIIQTISAYGSDGCVECDGLIWSKFYLTVREKVRFVIGKRSLVMPSMGGPLPPHIFATTCSIHTQSL